LRARRRARWDRAAARGHPQGALDARLTFARAADTRRRIDRGAVPAAVVDGRNLRVL
jgi:hypothetical protein